jgi:hypothetical protein
MKKIDELMVHYLRSTGLGKRLIERHLGRLVLEQLTDSVIRPTHVRITKKLEDSFRLAMRDWVQLQDHSNQQQLDLAPQRDHLKSGME